MLAYLSMMAPRLIELRRVPKSTRSIYLHCDETASHYLKILMDAIFGPVNFRNEIVWKRFNLHADAERFGLTPQSWGGGAGVADTRQERTTAVAHEHRWPGHDENLGCVSLIFMAEVARKISRTSIGFSGTGTPLPPTEAPLTRSKLKYCTPCGPLDNPRDDYDHAHKPSRVLRHAWQTGVSHLARTSRNTGRDIGNI